MYQFAKIMKFVFSITKKYIINISTMRPIFWNDKLPFSRKISSDTAEREFSWKHETENQGKNTYLRVILLLQQLFPEQLQL